MSFQQSSHSVPPCLEFTSSIHDRQTRRMKTRQLGRSGRWHSKPGPFRGHDVSLNSVSDLIVKLALSPTLEVRRSLGVSRA
jgi:hypothetical protein